MGKSIVIIGAGTAGLAAGCYTAMNGYRTTVLEMAGQPGGLCTSWWRQGFLFDASVAGLAGSAPGSPLYRLWQELGVIAYCPLHFGANFGRIRHPDGRTITVHADVDKLEAHLVESFPKDAAKLRRFAGGIRKVLDLDPPLLGSGGFAGIRSGLKSTLSGIWHLPAITKYSKITVRKFADQFDDPFLVSVCNNLVHFGGPDVPLLTFMLPLAYAHRKMAGFPVRGWLAFAQAIEKRLIELGGAVTYHAKVVRLFVEDKTVKGVGLEDGSRIDADIVVSAADGRFTEAVLLGPHVENQGSRFQPELLSDQPAQVNLGVTGDFSSDDGPMTYLLSQPFHAAGKVHDRITVHNRYYDPDAAPKGGSSLTVFLDSDYGFWTGLAKDGEYASEKQRAADGVVKAIESHRPGFASTVKVVDVSTPITRERYTGNWRGAMQAFRPGSNMLAALMSGQRHQIRGLQSFYMAGQWVEPWGGITTAAQSARKVVGKICRHDGKRFITTVP